MRVSYYIAILPYWYIVNTEASLCSRQTIPVYPLLCFRSRSCSECSNPLHLVDSKPQRFIPTDGLPLRALSPSGLGAQTICTQSPNAARRDRSQGQLQEKRAYHCQDACRQRTESRPQKEGLSSFILCSSAAHAHASGHSSLWSYVACFMISLTTNAVRSSDLPLSVRRSPRYVLVG